MKIVLISKISWSRIKHIYNINSNTSLEGYPRAEKSLHEEHICNTLGASTRDKPSLPHLIFVKDSRSIDQNRIHDSGLQARVRDLRASICAQETWPVGKVLASVFPYVYPGQGEEEHTQSK